MKMTPDHPKWESFIEKLAGPDACDFQEEGSEWNWDCFDDKTFAIGILSEMGLSPDEISDSLEFFESCGAVCDCEIVFNVGNNGTEEVETFTE